MLLIGANVLVYNAFPKAGGYISPLSMLTAFVGFGFFSKLKIPNWLGKIVCFVSPSMFGVYLLHECCIKSWQMSTFAAQSFGLALVWAVGLFVLCVGIDMIRRAAFHLTSKAINKIIEVSKYSNNQML